MLQLGALTCVMLGAILVLVGLVMIAPEVRIHQIHVYSAGSWVFRAGALLALAGLIMARIGSAPDVIKQVGLIVGAAAFLGGLFVWNHERAQALHAGLPRWDWQRSLTVQMFAAGVILLVVAALPG